MAKIKFEDLILFENTDFIAVNKPPFLSSLEDRNSEINLLKLAKGYHQDAQLCHRLDRDTSGILVVAKNPEMYRSMSMALEKREVIKIYHAICDGKHDFQDVTCALPLRTTGHGRVKIDRRKGKPSLSVFDTISIFKRHTLVQCVPQTGRTHQLRVHLTSLGAPISGDENYQGTPLLLSQIKPKYHQKSEEKETPIMSRFALHALKISFIINEETFTLEAPYPKDFALAIKQLSRHM